MRRHTTAITGLCGLALCAIILGGAARSGAKADAEDARHGAIAAEHPRAAAVGLEIMRRGGNAVDATIAALYAVCVLNFSSCGIGGGGFMLIHEADGAVHALDFRETAPALAHRNLYRRDGTVLAELSRRGALAVAVPGEVAGLEAARARFSRLRRAELMAPAIALARDGFPIGPHLAKEIANNLTAIRGTPALGALLLDPAGNPRREGDTIRLPALAATLQRIAGEGADGFYRGPIAAEIVRSVAAGSGIITLEDLARYRPRWREPLRGTYRGLEILTMPPPSSGGILLEIMNVLTAAGPPPANPTAPSRLHLLTEAMKHGFADRARWYGDPAYTRVPTDRLTSAEYGRELYARIRSDQTDAPERYGSAPDHGTTHVSVMAADGMAVSCTSTINTAFGAMLVAGESGVLLNNEMDDFAIAPGVPNAFGLIGGEANAVAAGKRPLSSMTPVIVRQGARPLVAAGGSGGPLIVSATLQTLLGILDFNMEPAAAVAARRIHHQWVPPGLAAEPGTDQGTLDDLARRGHTIRRLAFAGAVQVVTQHDGHFSAAADPRKGGAALTW